MENFSSSVKSLDSALVVTCQAKLLITNSVGLAHPLIARVVIARSWTTGLCKA